MLAKEQIMKSNWIYAGILITAASLASAETKTGQTASIAIGGKTITIKYSAPAVNGREGKLFGKDGHIGQDTNYPIWRAGANEATALHTDADLDIGGLMVPMGNYTLFVNLANPTNWELIVNKQTGQSGLEYDPKQDLGRVKMTMSKPPDMVEQLQYTFSNAGSNKARLQLVWEDHAASVNIMVK
jgi:Protein of unknown function (DUF2911)